MIVLSVGMPRAGSGWHYNLIHDLMRTTGCDDAADIRRRFHLEKVLTEVNCNIGVLSPRRLAMVTIPALLGHTFAIKAHSRPTTASRLLQEAGLLTVTYIYRDPRDAMVSAMDYGHRGLKSGRPNAFSDLTDFDRALDFMMGYVRIWEMWTQQGSVLVTRYEDLLNDYEAESAQLVSYLHLDPDRRGVKDVVAHYRPERAEGVQGTHYFKGRTGRYKEAFSADQQHVLGRRFGPFLVRMGYPA